MLIDKINSDLGIDPTKAVQGFGKLIIGLMEHAPQLALLALAAYADFSTGNIPALAGVIQSAAPVVDDVIHP